MLSDKRGLDVGLPGTPVGVGWKDLGDEGYVLKVEPSSSRVSICAGSPAGVYYGVQTLKQLVCGSGNGAWVPECTIVDRPALAIRGIKGLWWKPGQYVEMMAWLPEHKFNFFMFCYTMYPQTYVEWRKPFTAEQLAEMKRVVDYCAPRHVRVCLSINPSISAKPTLIYASEDDLKTLLGKLKSAYDIGVRSFAVCLDDIALDLQNDEDKTRFKNFGEAQGYFIGRLSEELGKTDPRIELIFCPTTYTTTSVSGPIQEEYITTIGKLVPPRVKVFWTGPVVCSPSITSADADKFGAWIGRKPFVWDNYPVNDYCPSRLYLGPLKNRSADLYEHISGWISNPMFQSEASKIPLATVADYLWNPEAYDPIRSHRAAIGRMAGGAGGYLQQAADLYADFLGEEPKLKHAVAERDLPRVERLISRLAADERLSRLDSDVLPILEGYVSTLKRRLNVDRPKAWTEDGVTFAGDELSGGAVDHYGSNYKGLTAANWVYAKPSGFNLMTGKFVVEEAPTSPCTVVIEAADDDFDSVCEVKVAVNGHAVLNAPSGFPNNSYATREFSLPAGVIVRGANSITVENLHEAGTLGWPPWFRVRSISIRPGK
jgi:hypothetical protein